MTPLTVKVVKAVLFMYMYYCIRFWFSPVSGLSFRERSVREERGQVVGDKGKAQPVAGALPYGMQAVRSRRGQYALLLFPPGLGNI